MGTEEPRFRGQLLFTSPCHGDPHHPARGLATASCLQSFCALISGREAVSSSGSSEDPATLLLGPSGT